MFKTGCSMLLCDVIGCSMLLDARCCWMLDVAWDSIGLLRDGCSRSRRRCLWRSRLPRYFIFDFLRLWFPCVVTASLSFTSNELYGSSKFYRWIDRTSADYCAYCTCESGVLSIFCFSVLVKLSWSKPIFETIEYRCHQCYGREPRNVKMKWTSGCVEVCI